MTEQTKADAADRIAERITFALDKLQRFDWRPEAARIILEEVKGLLEVAYLYRASHNFCIVGSAQGLCNKCRIAEAELAKWRGGA